MIARMAVPPILAYRLAAHIGGLLGWKTRAPPREEEWALPYFRRSFADHFGFSQEAAGAVAGR